MFLFFNSIKVELISCQVDLTRVDLVAIGPVRIGLMRIDLEHRGYDFYLMT